MPIGFSSYGRELTVFYETFHSHLDMFDEDNHEEQFDRAVGLITGIKEENLVFVSSYEEGRITTVAIMEPCAIQSAEAIADRCRVK